jgi:deazaflavin-dependent oxidoreductase (nitroreductase family)
VLTFTRDGDRFVVAASAGGSPTDPQWYRNVIAHPEVTVEAKGETFKAKATVTDHVEHDRLWRHHVAERPEFADYPEKAGRTIPVVTLERTE